MIMRTMGNFFSSLKRTWLLPFTIKRFITLHCLSWDGFILSLRKRASHNLWGRRCSLILSMFLTKQVLILRILASFLAERRWFLRILFLNLFLLAGVSADLGPLEGTLDISKPDYIFILRIKTIFRCIKRDFTNPCHFPFTYTVKVKREMTFG